MAHAGRFAPSPTGELHLGNLRTALVAWLFARSSGRRFLLRFEDLDPQRSSQVHAARQQADLAAIGLDFDPPLLWQSKRRQRYAEILRQLADHTYECYCTRREIAEAASAPHGVARRYPGTCARLSEAERAYRRSLGRPAALRLRAEGARETITDELHGSYTGTVEDIVLRRNDGVPAYHLAAVVDDLDGGIDQVVRGDDLLASAPAQAHLARLLGSSPPRYAHIPLVLNPEGRRLAKRDGAVTLADLARHQLSPGQVFGLLAHSLGLAEADEPVTPQVVLSRFLPDRLPRRPWVWQPESAKP